MSHPIRIAISGGGLAGAYLIHALLNYNLLDVHIFESAATFKEAGAAIGVARNALAALDLIGHSAARCLERAGAVPMRGVRFMLAQELLADVPRERMHASKKLDKVDQNHDGSIRLHFADGTTHECDILVGAEGIYSTVRKFILGEGDPAAFPRNTGSWAVMTLKPYAEARASIGERPVDIEDAREYISEEIKKLYQFWPPHFNKAVNEPPARSYVSGPICIMGDAAHATTPWQGSGGGMSIEDSLILSSLFGRAKTPAEAVTALKVYGQARRPRTQRIVESSRVTGTILAGRGEGTGLDLRKLREKLLPRWDFIIDFDNEKHCNEAVQLMERELEKGNIVGSE
ncbi:hypothetical protein DL770_011673 [Monosporascus sp. CRB-9-2]|nr:hypothetical protein DL770_011673 [Monosporascus sp. CRB-9-2]